jgi:hypothetical protein
MLALAGGLFALVQSNDGDRNVETVPPAGASGPPGEAVAVTVDGRVVVLDSQTGAELRTIADGGVAEPDGPFVATDGETVYFMRDTGARCDRNGDRTADPIPAIARVSVDGGPVETIASGVVYPALSPDGRFLAFTGVRNCSDAGSSILVQDVTQPFGTWRTFDATDPSWVTGIFGLSWAPDSRNLLFQPGRTPEGEGSYLRLLDTAAPVPLDETPFVLHSDGSGVDAYLGNTGRLLGTYAPVVTDPDQRIRVIAIEPVISSTVDGPQSEYRELFRFPEQCCSQQFTSDTSGDHILGVSSTGDLYRWSTGDAEPTRIATGISAAAWVPNG